MTPDPRHYTSGELPVPSLQQLSEALWERIEEGDVTVGTLFIFLEGRVPAGVIDQWHLLVGNPRIVAKRLREIADVLDQTPTQRSDSHPAADPTIPEPCNLDCERRGGPHACMCAETAFDDHASGLPPYIR
jgi:hypothetical protein